MNDLTKMDFTAICEMFETIKSKIDKLTIHKPTQPIGIDLSAINAVTERLETMIEEIRKPAKIEHRHTIAIGSVKIFLSWAIMATMILGLSFFIGNQRQTINSYRYSDLKYRYIRMQGMANEESLYRMEQQFKNGDSIKIIRRQVEKYEDLVKEQAERIERIIQNRKEAEQINREVETLRER
jgi:uncharacterized protein HemX